MQRLTITIDDDLLAEVDDFMAQRGYANRSEAFRDLLRGGLERAGADTAGGRNCIATLSYVYDHTARELPKRSPAQRALARAGPDAAGDEAEALALGEDAPQRRG